MAPTAALLLALQPPSPQSPASRAASSARRRHGVPAAVPLLLVRATGDLFKTRIGSVATVIGTTVAYVLFPMRSMGQDSWKVAAALMAGGAVTSSRDQGAFALVQVTVHIAVVVGRLMGLERKPLLIALQRNANVGGPTTAAAMATASSLIVQGIVVRIFGTFIATFPIGFGVFVPRMNGYARHY